MSTDLTSTKIKNTFNQLLHVDGGVTSTPKTVYDGDGTATSVKISTSGLQVNNSEVLTDADIGNSIQPYDPELIQEIQDNADSAAASATASANSATNAGISASQASTSASNAATSATNAANSATQAANSAASAAAIVTGVASNRPSIRPSLLLDFSNTKQLDPRITFSRPTTATYYDGKTVVKAEENLLKYSQDFDNAAWEKQATSVTANSTTSPDGTTTAELILANTSATNHSVYQNYLIVNTIQYTVSIYSKAQSYDKLYISDANAGGFACSFDLTNVTFGTPIGSYTNKSAAITPIGNGWYRCSITFTATASQVISVAFVGYPTGATLGIYSANYTGDGTSGIYLWGAQVEQRSTVTAYTPTTTAPITNYIPALQTAVSNDARFDHDPVTGESKGLLIEEQRTNLLTYSDQFDNAAWGKDRVTITTNTVVAPDGTLTGDKLVESATSGQHSVYRGTSAGASLTYSMYAKKAERQYIAISLYATLGSGGDGIERYAIFDLNSGTVTAFSGITANSATINDVGNGWYRVSINYAYSATYTINTYAYITTSLTNINSYTGNGYSGLYIWGAQLEAGSFPTSYIPTVASQVTRSADSASITGSNFSSWYRADEGTMYADFASGRWGRVWSLEPIAVGSYLALTNDTSVINADYYSQGINAAVSGSLRKAAVSIGLGQLAISGNGGTVTSTTSSDYKGLATTLYIGSRSASQQVNGTIKRLAFYPKRLSNTELQGLTS